MFRGVLALAFVGALIFGAAGAQAAPPIEAYGKLPAVEEVSLSPSGQRFAMIAVAGQDRTLIVATTDSKPLFAAKLGVAKVRAIDWAGEDHLVVTLRSTVALGLGFTTEQQELDNAVALNIRAGKLTPIFTPRGAIEPVTMGTYGSSEIKGKWYGYFGGITMEKDSSGQYYLTHSYSDLYQVDLDTGAAERVAEGSEISDDWLVGPDGEVVARSTYDQRRGDWRVYKGGFGGPVLASGNSPFAGAQLPGFGRKPDSILVRIPDGHGSRDEEIPLAGGAAVEAPDDASIAGLLVDRISKTWIGYTDFGDVPEPKMFDPVVGARVRGTRKAFPDQSVRFDSWSQDFSRLIVFTSGGDDSGTYWFVDIAKGSADPIGREYPDVQPADVGPIKMVDWKAADGLQLHGVLSLPPSRPAHNLPVVVMPHGGPEDRDYPVFDWWAQAFASQGYAVFQPNFRGSSGYTSEFVDAGQGQWGRKMQTDVSDGLAELARQGIVDPRRACIVGASYGGYAALAGVTVQHGLYRCAVSDAGVSDLAAMLRYEYQKRDDVSATTRYWKTFMGPESGF